ncbi:MAG: dynamin family protein [Scytonema sp. PMC 1069.18]|nr:dynamin family protein [Scytonema sp. PMC 1069.18]MEC4885679.1 dynamin family protein [Scytonema sp. PMC 1070.18]
MNKSQTGSIANIVEKRHPLAEKITSTEAALKSLDSAVQHIGERRNRLMVRIDDSHAARLLQEINLVKLQQSINTELENLFNLKKRLDSQTLKIAVFGRAKQGKSRLLQSLTGLSAAEIPDGDKHSCTGVPCTISHNPSEQTYAEVWFHSEESFLEEVIGFYYEKLRLGVKPKTIDEFAVKPLPPLSRNSSVETEEAMYLYLAKYHTNLEKYRYLLEQPSPYHIAKDEIREYVAQQTTHNHRLFYNYLAVREVKIFCQFPHADVRQIVFIDTPGIGNTGICDEQSLIKKLGKDIDVILFVRMPKSTGDRWEEADTCLYDTIRTTLVDIPLNLWSFTILNHTEANSRFHDNLNICESLAKDSACKTLHTVKCITANCASTKEANKVLEQILEYLDTKITDSDDKYSLLSQERLTLLQKKVNTEMEKACKTLNLATQDVNGLGLFETKFQELWRDLSHGFEKLLKDLRKNREAVDVEFKQQVEKALQTCRSDTGIPSISEIEQRYCQEKNYTIVYEKYLHEIRARLSRHLLSLDCGLKKSLDKVKSQVTQVLIDKGRLENLTEARGAEFIQAVAEQIPDELIPGIPSQLHYGFQILAEFKLSYRGFVQHRIRKSLDGLTPNEPVTQKLTPSSSAEQVLLNLKIAYAETIGRCENALKQLLCEPNQAAFTMVEEFVDIILRTPDVESEWRIFLQDVRWKIWQEFQQLGDRTQLRYEVLDSAVQAASYQAVKLGSPSPSGRQ